MEQLEDEQTVLEARRALEALVVDKPELERLVDVLDPFNVFEAMGAVSQEVRHSDLLSWMDASYQLQPLLYEPLS
ncbi:MAG: hypothetical protein AB7T32_17655 [Dehalococcoidia bacterium]